MLVRREYVEYKRGEVQYHVVGWYLFNWIPLYI